MTRPDKAIIEQVIEKLKVYKIESYEPLNKGYSSDKKYILVDEDHQRYILKLSSSHMYDRKLEEFNYIGLHHTNGVRCPKALEFAKSDELGICYMLLSFMEGESAEELLASADEADQYRWGYEAAQELKKIHQVENTHDEDWYTNRWNKYLSKKEKLVELGVRFNHQEEIEDYIEENFYILKDSPIRFQHDDFHPMNIILKNDSFQGVIDFDRFSWGDPIEDFFKIPKYTNDISIHFSIGQIKGYFNDQVPKWFWRRYNLFIALNFHASFIAAHAYNQYKEISQRQDKIFVDHDFENQGAPTWYVDYALAKKG